MLTWQAASLCDAGKKNTEAAAHAKRFSADTAMEVTTDAVQVYEDTAIEEYPVARSNEGGAKVGFTRLQPSTKDDHWQRDYKRPRPPLGMDFVLT